MGMRIREWYEVEDEEGDVMRMGMRRRMRRWDEEEDEIGMRVRKGM